MFEDGRVSEFLIAHIEHDTPGCLFLPRPRPQFNQKQIEEKLHRGSLRMFTLYTRWQSYYCTTDTLNKLFLLRTSSLDSDAKPHLSLEYSVNSLSKAAAWFDFIYQMFLWDVAHSQLR